MAAISRASKNTENKNRLRIHKVKIFIQRFPGKIGTDQERGVTDKPDYQVTINGVAGQWGVLDEDGGVEVYIPSGSKAILEVLGTSYELTPLPAIEKHDTLSGCQRRLNLLGYYDSKVDNKYGKKTDSAALNFQADNGLDPNGKLLDATTYDKIKNVFGE